MKNKGHNLVAYLIFVTVVVLIPGVVGGILSGINQDLIYLEVIYVIFGLINLMLITIRIRMRDSKNYKKDKTITEDKTADSYRIWIKEQYLIAITGIIDLVISLVVFAISQAI